MGLIVALCHDRLGGPWDSGRDGCSRLGASARTDMQPGCGCPRRAAGAAGAEGIRCRQQEEGA